MKNGSPGIKYLFEPGSIPIVGASHNTNKIGYLIVENILLGGYAGTVYLVNPKGGQILGHPVHRSVESIRDSVDSRPDLRLAIASSNESLPSS